MVDTALRPRPDFGTFLKSDANTGGNALTYHNYQRLLRSQKVALLQEKRAKAYVPGYKRPAIAREAAAGDGSTRRIFKLRDKSTVQLQPGDVAQQPAASPILASREDQKLAGNSSAPGSTRNNISLTPITRFHAGAPRGAPQGVEMPVGRGKAMTERLPRVFNRGERQVKSATVRERRVSWPNEMLSQPPRPKTAGGLLDVRYSSVTFPEAETSEPPSLGEHGTSMEGKSLRCTPVHRRVLTEGAETANLELPSVQVPETAERDALAKAFCWSTSTQRGYDEVGWAERMASPVPPPATTVERFPDPVSHRLTLRRYHSVPAAWQSFAPEWDYSQTRVGDYLVGNPHRVVFTSAHRKNQQIPGYTGCIPGIGECDNISGGFNPTLLVRTLKPRPTKISRRANIPGYTGHVHWTTAQPAHTHVPETHLSSTARVHRSLPLEEEPSPFGRTGVFSKTVTVVSPYNPFNKIEQ